MPQKQEMKFYLAIILVIVAVVVADQEDDLWESYKVYCFFFKTHKEFHLLYLIFTLRLIINKAKFDKNHPPEKEASRKQKFIQKQRQIEKHNKENKNWKMTHNKFTDLV